MKKVISLGSEFENAGVFGCTACIHRQKSTGDKACGLCDESKYTLAPVKKEKKK